MAGCAKIPPTPGPRTVPIDQATVTQIKCHGIATRDAKEGNGVEVEGGLERGGGSSRMGDAC